MQDEVFEKISEAGKHSYSAIQDLSEINTRIIKELADLQMSIASDSIESGVEFTKTMGSTGNYKDLLVAEAEFTSKYGKKMIEYGRRATDVLSTSRDEVFNWLEKNMESATTEKKAASKRTTRKSA